MADNGELSGYKCPNCAAPLVFNGELQKMVCEYCDSQFDMSEFSKDAVHRDEKSEMGDFNKYRKDRG